MTSPNLGFFNTGETAIHFAEWPGERPYFLFIHGLTGDWETAWSDVVPMIRGGHGAIAVDLRGHGRSGHTSGHYLLTDCARDLAALIKGKDPGPVNVIAHSFGALVSVKLAANWPDLVLAAALEDPQLFDVWAIMNDDDPARREAFVETLKSIDGGFSAKEIFTILQESRPDAPVDALMAYATNFFQMDGGVIAQIVNHRIDWEDDNSDLLACVSSPVLIFQGDFELGSWMRPDAESRAREVMKDFTWSKWEGVGHQLHANDPEKFVQEVRGFFIDR